MEVIDSLISRIAQWQQSARGPLSLDVLRAWSEDFNTGIHLAVMIEPYLSKIHSGEKFIESRLTRVNIAPYRRADCGDIILFKLSGGPVTAAAQVEKARFEEFGSNRSPASLAEAFASGLGYEPGYIESKAEARFASLLWLSHVRPIGSIPVAKSSRQGWVTFQPNSSQGSAAAVRSQTLF